MALCCCESRPTAEHACATCIPFCALADAFLALFSQCRYLIDRDAGACLNGRRFCRSSSRSGLLPSRDCPGKVLSRALARLRRARIPERRKGHEESIHSGTRTPDRVRRPLGGRGCGGGSQDPDNRPVRRSRAERHACGQAASDAHDVRRGHEPVEDQVERRAPGLEGTGEAHRHPHRLSAPRGRQLQRATEPDDRHRRLRRPDLFESGARFPAASSDTWTTACSWTSRTRVARYAPSLQAQLARYPGVRKSVTTDKGQTRPTFPFVQKPTPEQVIYGGLHLRKDWIDKLGLKVPVTMEEWHAVLTAFRTRDPNGNGKADEIPMSNAWNKGTEDLTVINVFKGAYGVTGSFMARKDNRIAYGPLEPGYRQWLAEMRRWYAEELIDPDYLTNDRKAIDANILGNRVGACSRSSRHGPWRDTWRSRGPASPGSTSSARPGLGTRQDRLRHLPGPDRAWMGTRDSRCRPSGKGQAARDREVGGLLVQRRGHPARQLRHRRRELPPRRTASRSSPRRS